MKRILLLFALSISNFAMSQDWIQLASRDANGRYWAASFTADGKVYTGTGKEAFSDLNPQRDMWQYDPTSDAWTQIADFPGGNREGATGFSYGNRGFMGFGSPFIQFSADLYEYLPQSDTWEAKTPCPAVFAYSTGFVIGDFYYIGPENGTNKVYRYSILEDTWSTVADFPGQDRRAQVAFAANGKGYVGMGMFVFGGVLSDFFEYDPITDTWTEIASISPASDQSCGFSLNGDGYVYNVGGNNKSIYRYSVADDQWVFESSFPGDRIANATITTLDGKAYLSNGERTLSGGNFASNQIWAFTPSSVGFDEKNTPQVSVFQQANGQLYYTLSSNDLSKQTSVSVFDLTGRLITTEQITQEQGEIHIPKASGCYILQFISNGNSLGSVKVLR